MSKEISELQFSLHYASETDSEMNTSAILTANTTAFARSTLLKKLNAGDRAGACEEMKRWVYAGGKVWRGLVNRREAESALCHGNL